MSDRIITQDLMARLERHYIKPGQPFKGGIFVPECGLNGTTGRRCDALYVGFTSTSGRLLVGHEVKASRSDWLHELDQIDKATVWADQCHEWWLVTAPDVVRDGELPAGWGHMVPGHSKTRMTIKARPTRHDERQPSWQIVRSIMARLDTLQVQSRSAFEDEARRRAGVDMEKRLAAHRETLTVDPELRRKANVFDEIERHLGVDLGHWEGVRADEFAQALKVVRARGQLVDRWGHGSLARLVQDLRHDADAVAELDAALATFEGPEAVAG